MPWEKQFETETVLEQAMQAFWARGYEATSMQDLVTCMGVNRASLYATFGDKRGLFLAALKRYDDNHRKAFLEQLKSRASARESILGAFDDVIAQCLEGGSRDGCLLVNTALELSPHDPEVAAFVGQSLSEVEAFFASQIRTGQKSGEFRAELDATQTARALLGLLLGLRVLSRSRPEPALLQSLSRQAAQLLT